MLRRFLAASIGAAELSAARAMGQQDRGHDQPDPAVLPVVEYFEDCGSLLTVGTEKGVGASRMKLSECRCRLALPATL
jgi:hypothetical protein